MTGMRGRIALLVLCGVVTYWNALSAPFILDDHTSILTNTSIEALTLPGPLATPADTPVARRPLVNLSFAVTYALGEREVWWYHAGNLVIHILAALALFGIVRRTLLLPPLASTFGSVAAPLAWTSALVWLLHPLNSEVVDYVTQRSEGLLGLFYLLTLYCVIRAATARRPRRWTIAAVTACAAGMLCKESMATAPIVVLLFDRAFLSESWRELLHRRRALYSGLAGTWLVLAMAMGSSARTSAGFAAGASAWDYLLNQAQMIARYLQLTVWPQALVVDYGPTQPVPFAEVAVPLVLLTCAVLLVAVALVRVPRVAFPAAWFFITLAPTSSIVPIATEVGAERRMYLPLAGLVVLALVVAYWLARRVKVPTRVMAAAAIVLVLGLGMATVQRNRDYMDPVRLARTVVDRWPSGRAFVQLGTLLEQQGSLDAAIAEYRKAAAAYPPGHYVLGVALVQRGALDEGMSHLRTFVRLVPEHDAVTGARDLIGRVLTDRGDLEGASRQFEQLLADDAYNPRATALLAEVRLRQERVDEAISLFQRARRLDPRVGRDATVMQRFGTALAARNRLPEAERVFAEAAAANPQNATLQKLWGRSLAAQGRFAIAAERFRRARELAPNDAEARDLVAAIERRLGVTRAGEDQARALRSAQRAPQ